MSAPGSPSNRVLRLRAARHELRCRECRVTWLSWLQRLAGRDEGYTPLPRVSLARVQADRDRLADAIRTHRDIYRKTTEEAARPLGVDPESIITPVERRLWATLDQTAR